MLRLLHVYTIATMIASHMIYVKCINSEYNHIEICRDTRVNSVNRAFIAIYTSPFNRPANILITAIEKDDTSLKLFIQLGRLCELAFYIWGTAVVVCIPLYAIKRAGLLPVALLLCGVVCLWQYYEYRKQDMSSSRGYFSEQLQGIVQSVSEMAFNK